MPDYRYDGVDISNLTYPAPTSTTANTNFNKITARESTVTKASLMRISKFGYTDSKLSPAETNLARYYIPYIYNAYETTTLNTSDFRTPGQSYFKHFNAILIGGGGGGGGGGVNPYGGPANGGGGGGGGGGGLTICQSYVPFDNNKNIVFTVGGGGAGQKTQTYNPYFPLSRDGSGDTGGETSITFVSGGTSYKIATNGGGGGNTGGDANNQGKTNGDVGTGGGGGKGSLYYGPDLVAVYSNPDTYGKGNNGNNGTGGSGRGTYGNINTANPTDLIDSLTSTAGSYGHGGYGAFGDAKRDFNAGGDGKAGLVSLYLFRSP